MSLNKVELEKALFCAKLCHLVYEPDLEVNHKKISDLVSGIDVDKQFKYFDKVGFDTQAFVLQSGDAVFVVFQGTQTKLDWLANLIVRFKRKAEFGSYHTGFITVSELSFPSVGKHLISVIKENPNRKVVLTGHSLGGAMATMYAHILKQKYPSVSIESLITFGQPRCGNFKFTEYLNSLNLNYKRFVNTGDYIADVPVPFLKGLWSHAGLGYVLTESEMLLDNVNYESNLSFRILTPLKAIYQLYKANKLNKESIKKISSNHDMPLYIQNLEKEIARK